MKIIEFNKKIHITVGTPPVQRRTIGPIVNLTQHKATLTQLQADVSDLEDAWRKVLQTLLTFDELPDHGEIVSVAENIAALCREQYPDSNIAMIGGTPFLMSALETALIYREIQPLYAFSKREIVKETMADGSVEKTNVFRHIGFVEAVQQDARRKRS